MNELEVYIDYVQTMCFLRASRNRVLNLIETSNIDVAPGDECITMCHAIYETHIRHGAYVVDALAQAIPSRNYNHIQQAMITLHKHNRQTAKLSKLFEEDISDYHPESLCDDEPDPPPKPINISIKLTITKFLTQLKNWIANNKKYYVL